MSNRAQLRIDTRDHTVNHADELIVTAEIREKRNRVHKPRLERWQKTDDRHRTWDIVANYPLPTAYLTSHIFLPGPRGGGVPLFSFPSLRGRCRAQRGGKGLSGEPVTVAWPTRRLPVGSSTSACSTGDPLRRSAPLRDTSP